MFGIPPEDGAASIAFSAAVVLPGFSTIDRIRFIIGETCPPADAGIVLEPERVVIVTLSMLEKISREAEGTSLHG